MLFAYAEVKDPYGAGASDGTPLANGLVSAEIDGRPIENAVTILEQRCVAKTRCMSFLMSTRLKSVRSALPHLIGQAVITEGLQAGKR